MADLETILTRAQDRLRPANRITHPEPLEDKRDRTDRLCDWLDEHESGIMAWGLVVCGVLAAGSAAILVLAAVATALK